MHTQILRILTTGLALCAAAGDLAAQVTLTTVHTFTDSNGDGANPFAGLVQGSDGLFYGTTERGGTNMMTPLGTVFQINTNGGDYTILHSFPSYTSLFKDGEYPTAVLVEDKNNPGTFYGTTQGGGTNGWGTVFRISLDGTYTLLHWFSGRSDGSDSESGTYAGLVQGIDGNFYGTTSEGGTNTADAQGTVFQITSKGDVTILHSFIGSPTDGEEPLASLVQASDGNFYGTTDAGGTNTGNEYGTVFQWNTNGSLTTLHTFVGDSADGSEPEGALVQGLDGNLYGTASGEGPGSAGIVFRISPTGSNYTILHPFPAFTHDGAEPVAGLVLGSDGNFYGTTELGGGTNNGGTIFRISPTGSYTNLYSFTRGGDGGLPYGGLVQGNDGNFYGTTETYGTNGYGTVFRLTVPLNSPANQISAIQVAGTNVLVTISSVAAERYQLQYLDSLTSGAWSNINATPVTSIGGRLIVTNFGGASLSRQFYRFAIIP